MNSVEEGTPLASKALADLGIPPYDILRIDAEDSSGFFLLAADRDAERPGDGREQGRGVVV